MYKSRSKTLTTNEIGNWLLYMRTAKRLTRKTIAHDLGISDNQLHKYENGITAIPAISLLRLIRYYGASVDEFLRMYGD